MKEENNTNTKSFDTLLDATLKNLLCSEPVTQRCFVKKCSKKFRKIHRKTPVPESLFK